MSVSRGEIKASLKNGASFDDLKSTLFCCTGCGTCESRVRKIIEEEAAASSSPKLEKAE